MGFTHRATRDRPLLKAAKDLEFFGWNVPCFGYLRLQAISPKPFLR
jgi:hypothetical protein